MGGEFRLLRLRNINWIHFTILVTAFIPSAIGLRSVLAGSGAIPATVEIRVGLIIANLSQLNFGQVRPGETDGTVIVTTDNMRFATGGTSIIGPQFNRAECAITGQPGSLYNIVPGFAFSVHDHRKDPIPGVTLLDVVDIVTYSKTVGAETTIGQIGPDGTDLVYIGATLIVPTTALNGLYEGTVELSVNY